MLQTPNGYYLIYHIPELDYLTRKGFQIDKPVRLQVNRNFLKELLYQRRNCPFVYVCKHAPISSNHSISLKFGDFINTFEICNFKGVFNVRSYQGGVDLLCDILLAEIKDIFNDYKRHVVLIHRWMSMRNLPEDLEGLVLRYVYMGDKDRSVEVANVELNKLDDERYSIKFVDGGP